MGSRNSPQWIRSVWAALAAVWLVGVAPYARADAPAVVSTIAQASQRFVAALTPEQRKDALLPFEHRDRTTWRYTPGSRAGVTLKDLNTAQRESAMALVKALTSAKGYLKVTTIMQLEVVLRELSGWSMRDPELYTFAVFGEVAGAKPWGVRIEGHHLSLNFTFAGERVSESPMFLGANPAEVKSGAKQGTRALAAEQDIAFELLASLTPEQRKAAIVSERAYGDIASGTAAEAKPLDDNGAASAAFSAAQNTLLVRLLAEYASTLPDALAQRRMEKVRAAGLDKIKFAWAGATDKSRPHYYRLQGPTFLLEFDASQDGGNHIHTVWRDFKGDFGRDLLREHYQKDAHR